MAENKQLHPLHQKLRLFLYTLLALSTLFMGGMVLTYAAYRYQWIERDVMTPYLFKADIAQFQTRAYFSDVPGRYKIANELLRLSFASSLYRDAGKYMIEELAQDGYAPAQYDHARHLKFRFPLDENRAHSENFMKLSARQGYQPAIDELKK